MAIDYRTLGAAIAGSVVAVSAAITAGVMYGGMRYEAGYDTGISSLTELEKQLEAAQKRLELNATAQGIDNALEYLADLKKQNDALWNIASFRDELQDVNLQLQAATDENAELQKVIAHWQEQWELAAQRNLEIFEQNTKLQERLRQRFEILEQEIIVAEASEVPGLPGAVLAVRDIFDTWASVTVDGTSTHWNVGQIFDFQGESQICRLVFSQIDDFDDDGSDEALFRLNCSANL